jgi:hypothetical protein
MWVEPRILDCLTLLRHFYCAVENEQMQQWQQRPRPSREQDYTSMESSGNASLSQRAVRFMKFSSLFVVQEDQKPKTYVGVCDAV